MKAWMVSVKAQKYIAARSQRLPVSNASGATTPISPQTCSGSAFGSIARQFNQT